MMPQALRKGESQETVKNQWMKDIITFRDKCKAKTAYTFGGEDASDFINDMAQNLDNDKMTLDIQNQDISKIQSKKNNLEQSAMSAFNDIDTEIKFERLKREELQDL